MVSSRQPLLAVLCLALLGLGSAAACAPSAPEPDSEQLAGADEDSASADQGLSGSIAVGTTLVATAGLNLRSGPSTSNSVRHVVPEGGRVVVQQSSPSHGFYKVKHNGTLGWSYGAYLELDEESSDAGDEDEADDAGGDTQGSTRTAAMNRAKASEGFSYWWGHGRFRDAGSTSSNRGSCSGSCPSCSHSGQYGGDCSGLAAKVWQVPSSNSSLSDDEHPYSTADFINSTSSWSRIGRDGLKQADMLVYREGGAGHIFVYDRGDAWGSMYAYECKGCATGCISGFRTASSAYKAIRRAGW